MKKYLGFILFVFLSSQYSEASYPEAFSSMPNWCAYGSWSSGSAGTSGASYDYLKAEVDKYNLVGSNVTIKGDGKYLINKNDTVYFYDSLSGYLGSAKANTEGNAYLTYKPQSYSSQNAQIWVMKNLPAEISYAQAAHYTQTNSWPAPILPFCSKKDVFFQYKPYLAVNGGDIPFNLFWADGLNINQSSGWPRNLSRSFYYEIDPNSKAIKENTGAKISIYAKSKNNTSIKSTIVNQMKGTLYLEPSIYYPIQGSVTFYAEINDGTFSSGEIYLGSYSKPMPTMPPSCAIACPASLSSMHKAICQSNSDACQRTVW